MFFCSQNIARSLPHIVVSCLLVSGTFCLHNQDLINLKDLYKISLYKYWQDQQHKNKHTGLQ